MKGKEYRVTEFKIRRWFNIFNKVIFDNTLYPFKRIECINHPDAYAYCIPLTSEDGIRYNNLSINPVFKTRRLFLEVLAHEMVHAWQWQVKELNDLSHGRINFFCWKEKFSQYNIRLMLKRYPQNGDSSVCHISKAIKKSKKTKKPTIKSHPLLD